MATPDDDFLVPDDAPPIVNRTINAPEWFELLDDLLSLDAGLTAWEMDFLESLDRQRERDDFEPSDRQAETLERIHRQRV